MNNEWEENSGDMPLPPVWDEKRGEYVSETPNQLFAESLADLRRLLAKAKKIELSVRKGVSGSNG